MDECNYDIRMKERVSAKTGLKERRQRAEWTRLLVRPIRLTDGAVLFTLGDAAKRILEAPAKPSTRVAAVRIIEAALQHGDMHSTQAALRLALQKDVAVSPPPDRRVKVVQRAGERETELGHLIKLAERR
jgi:hypothetical protein